jgi:hypothetical protein
MAFVLISGMSLELRRDLKDGVGETEITSKHFIFIVRMSFFKRWSTLYLIYSGTEDGICTEYFSSVNLFIL